MKLAAFNVMLKGAQNTLSQHEQGLEVNPHALEWSRTLVAANPKPKDARPRPVQEPILELFLGDVMRYITRQDVLNAFPDMPGWKVDRNIKTLIDNGAVHALHAGVKRRYFLSPEARQQGRIQFEKEQRACEELARERRMDRDRQRAARTERKPKPVERIGFSKKNLQHKGGQLTKQGEVFIPDHVVVQVCPGYEDRRFQVNGPIEGGFLSEWYELRKKR